MSNDVQGTGQNLCDCQVQIKYFLVNASSPKQLHIATSNLAVALVT